MSADRRKKILIGFGAVAVVLVVAIAVVSPKFKNEDAIGAIGAVQKHRAPQITQKDVVLGDEQTKKQQQLLYGDFLADAAALQTESAVIAARTESSSQAASRILARENVVRVRYLDAAAEQIAGIKALHATDAQAMGKLEALATDVAAASSKLGNGDFDALQVRLADEFASIDAVLRAQNLNAVEADVVSLGALIEQRKDLDGARSVLARATEALDAQSHAAAVIRDRAGVLETTAKEIRVLQSVEEALSAGSSARSDAAMDFASTSQMLGDEATALAHSALMNMKNHLNAETAMVDAIGRMASAVNAVSKTVDSQANTYNATSLAAFRQETGSFARHMETLNEMAEARAKADMSGQMQGIRGYLDSARQLDASARSHSLVAECQGQLRSITQAAQSNAVYASVLSESALGSSPTYKSRNQ